MQKSFSLLVLIPILLAVFISVFIIPHIVNSLERSGIQVVLVSSQVSYSSDNSFYNLEK